MPFIAVFGRAVLAGRGCRGGWASDAKPSRAAHSPGRTGWQESWPSIPPSSASGRSYSASLVRDWSYWLSPALPLHGLHDHFGKRCHHLWLRVQRRPWRLTEPFQQGLHSDLPVLRWSSLRWSLSLKRSTVSAILRYNPP